jgi:hypothetical protein
MSSAELSRWLAYDQLDQVPDPVLIGARVACVIANVLGRGRYSPHDFTGRLRPKPRVMSAEVARAIFKGVTRMQETKTSRR